MTAVLLLQVLSNTVADALAHYGEPDTRETERFVRFMDRFFDMLNTRSVEEGSNKRKPDLDPYRTPDDSRLKVIRAVSKFAIDLTVLGEAGIILGGFEQ